MNKTLTGFIAGLAVAGCMPDLPQNDKTAVIHLQGGDHTVDGVAYGFDWDNGQGVTLYDENHRQVGAFACNGWELRPMAAKGGK